MEGGEKPEHHKSSSSSSSNSSEKIEQPFDIPKTE